MKMNEVKTMKERCVRCWQKVKGLKEKLCKHCAKHHRFDGERY